MKGLREIAALMNHLEVLWALGASSVLYFNGHPRMPQDYDIFVRFEDYPRVYQAFKKIGTEIPVKEKGGLYNTQGFSKFTCFSAKVDLIGGFNIFHAEGEYRLILDEKSVDRVVRVDSEPVRVMALEDWFILYGLIPGREEKSKWAFEAMKKKKENLNTGLLERALLLELPRGMKESIKEILEDGLVNQGKGVIDD